MGEFQTHVAVAVLVRVTDYDPGELAYTTGLPENCHPGRSSHFECELYDADGNRLHDVERLLDNEGWGDLHDQYEIDLKKRRECA